VLCVAFSPDKQLLAAGAMDGTVAVWDLASGGQLLHLAGFTGHHKPVRNLAFTPGTMNVQWLDSMLLMVHCCSEHWACGRQKQHCLSWLKHQHVFEVDALGTYSLPRC
jgi:WD40 repeat protein